MKKYPNKLFKTSQQRYYAKNRTRYQKVGRKLYLELKKLVMTHYSPNLECACCHENNMCFLTIDHIRPRKEMGHSHKMFGNNLLSWIKRNNFPTGFQVLCYNCNCAKKTYTTCPHSKLR